MDGANMSLNVSPISTSTKLESAPSIVFQPQKLKEVIDIIDLMGNIATRVREDSSGDMGGASGGGKVKKASGTSARDDAIANAPATEVMQKKLVAHLRKEIGSMKRQARKASKSNARGSAWALAELYKKIRSLSSLMKEILHASAEMIRRFYISVFIDQQSLVASDDSSAPSV